MGYQGSGANQGGNDWGELVFIAGVAFLILNHRSDSSVVQQQILPPAALPPPPLPSSPRPLPTDQEIQEILYKVFSNHFSAPTKAPLIYTPPVDHPLIHIVDHPAVVLIVGGRGTGKSALAVRVQELSRDMAAPFAVGLPPRAGKLLPPWYGLAEDFSTIPNNCTIYLPEAHRMFHSRSSHSAQGRAIGEIVNLSRHRKHTLIFDVQNPAHLDRNVLSEVDLVLIKEPGPFQRGFERSQFRSAMDGARAAFLGLGRQRRKRAVWVVAPGAGITGQLMENLLPTFWSESLSRIFGDVPISPADAAAPKSANDPGKATSRRGQRTSVEARSERAKKMSYAGHGYREIGRTLGCSASTAFRLVNR